MQVRFFGKLADSMGQGMTIDMGGPASIADLRAELASAFPAAAAELARPTIRACVGDRIVPDGFVAGNDATVEFLPTVSGG